jgi:small-conductance mechanosensitive channel
VEDLVTLRQTTAVILVLAALAASFVLMVDDAIKSGDWPGWDEAWVLIVFPLGIPLAVAAALSVGGPTARVTSARLVALVTGAVWLWGAAVFVVWFILGDRVPN